MTEKDTHKLAMNSDVPSDVEVATLGAGCFWCVEAAYRQLAGVYSATSGYMGGSRESPTYEEICRGDTGHAEVVRVLFDPSIISYERILLWFWDLHDPTQLNRQGNDVGTQYRSVIFYEDSKQKSEAIASKEAAQVNFEKKIVTEITKAAVFYPAENLHQGYYFENKSRNAYCQYVVQPKLKKLNLKY